MNLGCRLFKAFEGYHYERGANNKAGFDYHSEYRRSDINFGKISGGASTGTNGNAFTGGHSPLITN